LTALASLGCEDRARPWAGSPDGGVRDGAQPFLPGEDAPSWLEDGGLPAPEDADAGHEPTIEERVGTPSRVGGLWVSCYGSFAPSGQPKKDVTRLGMMCGPANGMRQLGATLEGDVTAAAPARHTFPVRAGDCYRLFAVARDVTNLDVTVTSGQGSRVAADLSEDAWPIVDPDRPICTFGDDTFGVEVASRDGAGPYALQIWQLQSGKSR
jgi:hypothetical protein